MAMANMFMLRVTNMSANFQMINLMAKELADTFSRGDKYVGGEFKDDDFHGQGTYTFSDGSRFVGEFT